MCFASGNSGGKSAFRLGSSLLALLPWLLFLLFALCAVEHFNATGMEQRGVKEGNRWECVLLGRPVSLLCWFGVGVGLGLGCVGVFFACFVFFRKRMLWKRLKRLQV